MRPPCLLPRPCPRRLCRSPRPSRLRLCRSPPLSRRRPDRLPRSSRRRLRPASRRSPSRRGRPCLPLPGSPRSRPSSVHQPSHSPPCLTDPPEGTPSRPLVLGLPLGRYLGGLFRTRFLTCFLVAPLFLTCFLVAPLFLTCFLVALLFFTGGFLLIGHVAQRRRAVLQPLAHGVDLPARRGESRRLRHLDQLAAEAVGELLKLHRGAEGFDALREGSPVARLSCQPRRRQCRRHAHLAAPAEVVPGEYGEGHPQSVGHDEPSFRRLSRPHWSSAGAWPASLADYPRIGQRTTFRRTWQRLDVSPGHAPADPEAAGQSGLSSAVCVRCRRQTWSA